MKPAQGYTDGSQNILYTATENCGQEQFELCSLENHNSSLPTYQ